MALAQRHSRALKWAALATKALLVLLLCEFALRGAFFARVRYAQPPNCGVRPELLGRLYFAYSRHRPSNEHLTRAGLKFDEKRGFRLAPNLRGITFNGAPLSTNSLGFRGATEYPVPKPTLPTRVLALGDSFTFGEGVTDAETWPAQLQGLLPGIEVANLGAPAYAHDQMLYALQDQGVAVEPDVVILGFYLYDKWRDELTFYCGEKPRFSRLHGDWRVENQPIPKPWEVYDAHRRLPLVYAVPRVLIETFLQAPLTDKSGDERATEIIRQIRALTESKGARFVLVNLPEGPSERPSSSGFFHGFCAQTGTECVDTAPLFGEVGGTDDVAALRAKFQLPNDIHYSPEGYGVVGEALRRHFTAHPIVPAGP